MKQLLLLMKSLEFNGCRLGLELIPFVFKRLEFLGSFGEEGFLCKAGTVSC